MHLFGDTAILIVFAVYLALYRGSHTWAPLFLLVSWYLPLVYSMVYSLLKINTADDTRIDERDYQIEARSIRDGFGLMSFGIFLPISLSDSSVLTTLNELFPIWILSRIVIDGKKLRLHAGWLPDTFAEWRRRKTLNRIANPGPHLRETAARFSERKKRRAASDSPHQ